MANSKDDEPLRLLLLLQGTAEKPVDLLLDWVERDGTFSFSGLPPGKYLLWCWRQTMRGDLPDRFSTAAWKDRATVVNVKAHESVDVVLAPQEGGPQ